LTRLPGDVLPSFLPSPAGFKFWSPFRTRALPRVCSEGCCRSRGTSFLQTLYIRATRIPKRTLLRPLFSPACRASSCLLVQPRWPRLLPVRTGLSPAWSGEPNPRLFPFTSSTRWAFGGTPALPLPSPPPLPSTSHCPHVGSSTQYSYLFIDCFHTTGSKRQALRAERGRAAFAPSRRCAATKILPFHKTRQNSRRRRCLLPTTYFASAAVFLRITTTTYYAWVLYHTIAYQLPPPFAEHRYTTTCIPAL